MGEMIDRVATDIGDSYDFGEGIVPFAECSEEFKNECRYVARKSIKALMYPTEKMFWEAGNIPNLESGRFVTSRPMIRAIWQAMLQAALNEDGND